MRTGIDGSIPRSAGLRRPGGRFAILACLLAACRLAACVPPGSETSSAAHPDRNLVTQAQMQDGRFLTVYDAVQSMRSNWLKTRGVDSFSHPSEVRVYIDNSFLGDTSTLHNISVSSVSWVRWFDAVQASARWGLDHGAGVIFISTRPVGNDPSIGPDSIGWVDVSALQEHDPSRRSAVQ